MKQKPVEEIIIPLEKRDEILNKLRKWKTEKTEIKMKHYKISKQLNDSTVSKKWVEVIDLSSGQYFVNKNI